ncbi:MAG: TrkA family potassium uptake protein [Anaerolineae bacterium]
MNVIVVGCGRVGAELAHRLFINGHRVCVIDHSQDAFRNLPPDFRGRTLEGDVLSEAVLHRADIAHADALAAVTNCNSLNGVIGRVASHIYHVPHVALRNYDTRWRQLVDAFGLNVVSPSSWGAQRLEELLEGGSVHPLISAGSGEVEICDLIVPASWDGRTVQDLAQCGSCVVAAVTRGGRGMLPTPEMHLQVGDMVHVSATVEGMTALRQQVC